MGGLGECNEFTPWQGNLVKVLGTFPFSLVLPKADISKRPQERPPRECVHLSTQVSGVIKPTASRSSPRKCHVPPSVSPGGSSSPGPCCKRFFSYINWRPAKPNMAMAVEPLSVGHGGGGGSRPAVLAGARFAWGLELRGRIGRSAIDIASLPPTVTYSGHFLAPRF